MAEKNAETLIIFLISDLLSIVDCIGCNEASSDELEEIIEFRIRQARIAFILSKLPYVVSYTHTFNLVARLTTLTKINSFRFYHHQTLWS